jgi:hypothetical protein
MIVNAPIAAKATVKLPAAKKALAAVLNVRTNNK